MSIDQFSPDFTCILSRLNPRVFLVSRVADKIARINIHPLRDKASARKKQQIPQSSPRSLNPSGYSSPAKIALRRLTGWLGDSFSKTTPSALRMVSSVASQEPAEQPAAPPKKLVGRQFYESIGSPKYIVAPMVDRSEFVCSVFPLFLHS